MHNYPISHKRKSQNIHYLTNIMDEALFVRYFTNLPNNVLLNIFDYLPSDYIAEVFLRIKDNNFRNSLIELFYRKEIHFILSPTRRPHICTFKPTESDIVDIETFYEIDDFLSCNNDINPEKILLITGGDFASLKVLLKKYEKRFSENIKYLEILIEKHEPTNEDLRLLLSFPNLRKLQFSGVELTNCMNELTNINKCKKLEEIVFLGHGINDWLTIRLPENLKHLDVSWNNSSQINSIHLPDNITDIYWNQAGINNIKLSTQRFPSRLKVLMLTYNNISSINISQLPRTLETIDLSNNMIKEFNFNGIDSWPKNLKSILLSHNLINNQTLLNLSYITWPEFLVNLKLDNNPFTGLTNLTNLPDNLHFLDVSSNQISSLENANGTLFGFPKFLKVLDLSNSDKMIHPPFSDDNKRITFPTSLVDLNLSECNIKFLNQFEFPKSLQKLSLSGNKIESLSLYDHNLNANKVSSWCTLTNLEELELYYNYISDLSLWTVPANLKRLDLRLNKLSKFTNRLFSEKMENLDIGENNISYIQLDLSLPSSLRILKLNNNSFSGSFSFFNLNANLVELNLSDNSITDLLFPKDDKISGTRKINLTYLDLSGNRILKERSSENLKNRVDNFYERLESGLGVQVKRKKFNVNSLHTF